MKLGEYRRKRDPRRTNEPFPEAGEERAGAAAAEGTREGAYVVHLHDATRRHYDLRFEVGGVLASFAVPKGPSLDPKERRLAIRTEDHPLEYLDFEEVIPEGNYGAGPMILWDRGLIRFPGGTAEEGLARGRLDIELSGHKLHGTFTLVRTGGAKRGRSPDGGEGKEQWLLIKRSDAFAAPERDLVAEAPRSVLSGLTVEEIGGATDRGRALEAEAAARGAPRRPAGPPARPSPMLCAAEGAPEQGSDWIYELKLDGVRLLAVKEPGEVRLFGRRGADVTATYPEVARAVEALAAPRLVLDGEVVALDEAGMPSFQRLAGRIHLQRAEDVRRGEREIPVVYAAFDLLAVGDRDLTPLPLVDRKALLARLLPGSGIVRALDHAEGNGRPLLALCRERGLEGAVAKRRGSPYRPGARSADWVKLKCDRDDELVIVGWTRGEGGRSKLGALDLASWEGDRLVYRGKVGSGFDERSIADLLARLEPLAVRAPVAEGRYVPAPRGRTHVRAELVASVRHAGFSEEGQVLRGVFRGLRDDVDPRRCTAGPKAKPPPEIAAAEERPPAPARATAPAPKQRAAITNPGKVLWPGEGITKQDLCAYYDAVAEVMLPYLQDRPVTLLRYPDGIGGKRFHQWSAPPGIPRWLRTARLSTEQHGEPVDAIVIDDVESLRYVANLAAIEIHPLAARAPRQGDCDFLTVDLDVKQSSLRAAVPIALELRELLEAIGLAGFAKTSGQTGLHVLAPLGPGIPFEAARALADLLGRILVQRHPEAVTMERSVGRRGARVFVDTGQTGRLRTIAAPYSPRAQPGAPVSTPLRWEEVRPDLDPSRFTMATVPARVASLGDPMRGMLEARPDVPAAVRRLEALVKRAA